MTDPIDPALKEVSSLKEKIKIGDVFVHYKTLPDLFEYRKNTGLNIHLTIDPDDDIETAFEIYPPDKLEKILIMTVNPGFQGSVFIPFALERIPKIFSLGFRGEIYLDGGINAKTVEEIADYKEYITALCVGSFLIKSRSKKEVIEKKTFLENFFKTA
jgi:pentose-5-phosphate-3-epimerase